MSSMDVSGHQHPVIPFDDYDKAQQRLQQIVEQDPDIGFVVAMLIRQGFDNPPKAIQNMEVFLHHSEEARARRARASS